MKDRDLELILRAETMAKRLPHFRRITHGRWIHYFCPYERSSAVCRTVGSTWQEAYLERLRAFP